MTHCFAARRTHSRARFTEGSESDGAHATIATRTEGAVTFRTYVTMLNTSMLAAYRTDVTATFTTKMSLAYSALFIGAE